MVQRTSASTQGASPIQRARPCHSTTSSAPSASSGSTSGPGAGTGRTAPGQPATVSATHRIQRVPCPMIHSPIPDRPTGASAAASTAPGITMLPMTGTATRLASRPHCDIWLKCAMPTGAVAAPATAEDSSTPITGRSQRGPMSRPRKAPKTATSATVAAKDIWNPGPSRDSGRSASTITAATATARKDSARRSSITATSATATMTKARCVATLPPDSAR